MKKERKKTWNSQTVKLVNIITWDICTLIVLIEETICTSNILRLSHLVQKSDETRKNTILLISFILFGGTNYFVSVTFYAKPFEY